MKIALCYPPPWKIAPDGEPAYPPGEGPPRGEDPKLEGDFIEIPYGLLSITAQCLAAGHDVTTLNLSSLPWPDVERVIETVDAPLWGLSCFTSNRRGVGMMAAAIRKRHPNAHIVVGGPHATALPEPMLAYHPAIDTIAIGEGETTFMEIVERLERGEPTAGMDGTAYRMGDDIVATGRRKRVRSLDSLASPHDYFRTPFVLTSRGCPEACTFCGSITTWGRKLSFHSVDDVLEMLETAVVGHGQRFIAVKDDTFSASRKRTLAICKGIRERNINFLWTCDTRADYLDEEILREMRLAGCQRLSLGIESGSEEILDKINKQASIDEMLSASLTARRLGFQVRYYLMVGNRGESLETLNQTVELIKRARPHRLIYSVLSVYPGTEEYEILKRERGATAALYFDNDFFHPRMFGNATPDVQAQIIEWMQHRRGHPSLSANSVEECAATLDELGEHHAAHYDLAAACLRDGDLDGCARHAERALELDFPLPGLCHNLLAVVAQARGDQEAAMAWVERAAEDYPHRHVMENLEKVRASPGLELEAESDLDLAVELLQPTNPGPVDFEALARGAFPPKVPPRHKDVPKPRKVRRLSLVS